MREKLSEILIFILITTCKLTAVFLVILQLPRNRNES